MTEWRETKYVEAGVPKTADMVEVVRCKDCDCWNDWDHVGHEKYGNYRCSCAHWSSEDAFDVYTGPQDFCSYAERKEV